MITISGHELDISSIIGEYLNDSIEIKILNILSGSTESHEYSSLNELRFELNMRKNIIIAAREFHKSRFKFKTFKKSICNTEYWERTDEGGFLLKENVVPSEAIKDIFKNGPKYGTECSTAIIIIYYKALLNIYDEDLFNMTFKNLQLMNWHYVHSDLDVYTQKQKTDFLPGDCRYFENPDFKREKPEWQGENAIDLGDGTYFGHGIGIALSEEIINALNKHRNSDSDKSAFLTTFVTLPNFERLSQIYLNYHHRRQYQYYRQCDKSFLYYSNYFCLPD